MYRESQLESGAQWAEIIFLDRKLLFEDFFRLFFLVNLYYFIVKYQAATISKFFEAKRVKKHVFHDFSLCGSFLSVRRTVAKKSCLKKFNPHQFAFE